MTVTPRQTELADAGLAIIARAGLAAVSFRTVAAESGWSLGAVQKAFPTKDALVAAMFARLRERAVSLPPTEPGRPTLHGWLTELFLLMMPIDSARREAYVTASAFGERAPYDPVIAETIAADDAGIAGQLAALIGRGRAEGEVADTVNPTVAADGFLALATGAATRQLYAPVPEGELRTRAEHWIAGLLG